MNFSEYYYPQMMMKAPADPEKFKKLEEAVEFLDGFLANTAYVAGDKSTIADYALIASFSTLDIAEFDYSRFENVTRWYELCKKDLAGIEANADGMEAMKFYVKKLKE